MPGHASIMNYHSYPSAVGQPDMSQREKIDTLRGIRPLEERPLTELPRPDRSTAERSTETETRLRAELYLRGDAYHGFGVRQVLTRFESLAAAGVFSGATLAGEWPRYRTRTEDGFSEAIATYEIFREWAERNGVSLEPGFQQRTRSFVGMDDVEEVVVFPVVALALYDDRDLTSVFPCTDEEQTYTVECALGAFEGYDADWLARIDPKAAAHVEPRLGVESLTAD